MKKSIKLKRTYFPILLMLYWCNDLTISIASPLPQPINSLQPLTHQVVVQTQQAQKEAAIYRAITEDIVQIFKWMESPDVTPAKLANNILLRQFNPNDIVVSTRLVGLPSVNYSNDETVKQYQSGGVSFYISSEEKAKNKLKTNYVVISPLTYNLKKRWFDNFSTIKLMKYLSQGTEKSQMREGGMAGYPSITQIINLKQKYFKSSRFKKYRVMALSYPDGSWNEPEGREFFRENYPGILLSIDPKE